MASHYSRSRSLPGGRAVGITLAPGPGRVAALTIVGVPLAILLIIGFITAHGGGGSPSGDNQVGAGAYPVSTQTAPASGDTGQTPPGDPLATGANVAPASSVTPTDSDPGLATASAPATATGTASPSPTPTGPAATVLAAYADINRHDYQAAYTIGLGSPQSGETVQEYAAGYADTASVAVTVTQVQGDTVWVSLTTTQTNGTHQQFSGEYTVSGNRITGAQVQQTN